MHIREHFINKYKEKFGEFGVPYEQQLYEITLNDCKTESVVPSWENRQFVERYFNKCADYLSFIKIKVDPSVLLTAHPEDLNPNYKKFIAIPTPPTKRKTVKYYCRRCGRDTENFATSAMTRSADEAKTNIYECSLCGYMHIE